jgi:exosortase A
MNTQVRLQHAMLDENTGSGRRTAVFVTLLVIALVLGIYHEAVWSIVAIWIRSETYAHGFLIIPFSIYMIWKRRGVLAAVKYYPSYIPLLVLTALGFGWLLASLGSALVVEQYVLVAMIPIIVWAMLGFQVFSAIIFPLAYLLFAVPFGDILIPPLIDFTADFTIGALQMTGIPVYREGSYFSIPSGNWSVVEACSGLRYLIASVTLGTLYAYLTYHSISRRLIFIAFSIIVPIIANGLRAYLIVMTGHLSDMKLAVGIDHLIYGWIFFGIVMLLLFWIGSFWREDYLDIAPDGNSKPVREFPPVSVKATLGMAGLVVVIAAIWPIYMNYLSKLDQYPIPEINISDPSGKWSASAMPLSNWRPTYIGAPRQFISHFRNESSHVNLYVAYYRNQRQGNELISSNNILVATRDTGWRNLGESRRDLSFDTMEFSVNQNQLHAPTDQLLIWRWFWLIDQETANPYLAKAILAMNQILGRGDDSAEIIVAAAYEHDPEEAASVLHEFLADMMPVISAELHTVKSTRD